MNHETRSARTRARRARRSPPMCPAGSAARRRAPRCTSCRPTRRRSGPSPAALAAFARRRRPAGSLSRRLGARAARGDRRRARPQPGPHPLRHRLGRDARPAGPRLSRPGDEAHLSPSTASWSTDRRSLRGRRHAGRRSRRSDLHAPTSTPSWRAVTREDAASSSSPTPTTRPAPTSRSTRCGGCMPGCRSDVILVLDAAYAEYVRRNDYESRHRAGRRPPTTW